MAFIHNAHVSLLFRTFIDVFTVSLYNRRYYRTIFFIPYIISASLRLCILPTEQPAIPQFAAGFLLSCTAGSSHYVSLLPRADSSPRA